MDNRKAESINRISTKATNEMRDWNYDLEQIPVERCHWLAIEQHYGSEFNQFVGDGFYDPTKDKYYFSDGVEIQGKVIAYMKRDKKPEFPKTK